MKYEFNVDAVRARASSILCSMLQNPEYIRDFHKLMVNHDKSECRKLFAQDAVDFAMLVEMEVQRRMALLVQQEEEREVLERMRKGTPAPVLAFDARETPAAPVGDTGSKETLPENPEVS